MPRGLSQFLYCTGFLTEAQRQKGAQQPFSLSANCYANFVVPTSSLLNLALHFSLQPQDSWMPVLTLIYVDFDML